MAGAAVVIRANLVWRWASASPWAGETATNTLHFLFTPVGDQPSVDAGQVNLNQFHAADETGTFTHTTSSQGWTCERGWSVTETTDMDGFFKDVVSAWYTHYQAAQLYLAQSLEFDSIRLYPVKTDGKSASNAPFIARPSTVLSPAGTGSWSPDISVVISLYSVLRSKKGRGRYYAGPLVPLTLDSNGLLTTSLKDQFGAPMAAFLTTLRDAESAVSGGWTSTPIVLNRPRAETGQALPLATGVVIKTVRVGDEIDVQERRTKSRKESYTDYAVT